MFITPYLGQQPVTDFSQRFATLLYSATLAISTDTTLTIPGDAPRYKALIKCEPAGEVWVALNNTASIPAGASFAATNSEMILENGVCREVNSGDVLHFFSATASNDVSVALYGIGQNN